ncbi:right-handed parallel beta-helix repeat-containing protein [Fibrella aquatica]|uniref:right-handed parallel beta-helix repeat-containing protein n=1 Tax=Fibrella aquatica TaxID=3242487 RepID=UPI00351FA81D
MLFIKKYIHRYRVLIKYTLLFFLWLLAPVGFAQTTYYVANTGNDGNNGTSVTTPFQNLSKINSLALRAGDQVLLRRGDTFRGTLSIRRSGSASQPIVFDAYGSGAKPILSGSVPLTGWTSLGNNVWQAPCPSCGDAVTGVYRNAAPLPLGRFPNIDAPNQGNLTIRAHTEKYQIFSKEPLPTNINWKGAEVVMRPAAWIIDRAVVDAQYGDALNLFNYSNYFPRDNSEYFFQNHPATLDRNGEWCYDKANKKILVYASEGILPSDTYTATVHGRAIDIANLSHIIFRNIHITETLNTSLFGQNVSNLVMSNLDVTNAGEDGVIILGSGNTILLENSKIATVNNNGIWIDPYSTVTIRGNSMRRIGILAGRGKSGDGQYNGITAKANQNVLIENNVIDSVGYNGINFTNNTTIRQNLIANYCFIKIDGGGIYTWNGNKTPMSNVKIVSNILYTKPAGNTPWVDYSIGIFLDDCTENVEIKGNTIFGHTQWGVFLHGTNNITFTDNTLFDNNASQLVVYHNGGRCPIRGNIIKRNVFISKTNAQLAAQYESNADDLLQYGLIDSNYYARPFNEEATIRGVINSGQGGNYELRDWQNFSRGQDLHSKSSPITYRQYRNEGSGGINRVASSFDTSNDDWQLVYSPYGNAEATLDNSNKLDGGSLKVSFPTLSGQTNSYAQVAKPIGAITKGKTYVLRFDAVATTDVPVLFYLRQYGAPYREFDRRYSVVIGPNRKSYELVFTAIDSESNAIVMVQTDREGPVFWLDNVRLQEDIAIQNRPDDFIKLYYNPTLRDSTVVLPAGAYRDVKNQPYANSLVLKPFTSVVLLKDTVTIAPADLSLLLYSDKRLIQVNEPTTMRLRVKNESNQPAELARWTFRLPAYIQFVTDNGQPYSDNVLHGTVQQLPPQADTLISVVVKPVVAGTFRLAAQLTTATSPDPDSSPNSGTLDGEDDASVTELRVSGATTVFESPNPNQRVLPSVASSQPIPAPNQADLSLQLAVTKRTPVSGESFGLVFSIANAGGRTADGVQVQVLLPEGIEFIDGANWTINGQLVSSAAVSVSAGTTERILIQVRATSAGSRPIQAQISASAVADPDSVPGNGFTNGEDDRAQAEVRVL